MMMVDGADLVAMVARGISGSRPEDGQGQDGENELFHGVPRITEASPDSNSCALVRLKNL